MQFSRQKINKMQNQRLLYSQSKKPRGGSINKENNIKLFNDSLLGDSLPYNKKLTNQLRFDYENSSRVNHRVSKTIAAEELTFSKPLQKSPLRKNIEFQQAPRQVHFTSNPSSIQLDTARLKPSQQLSSQQQQIQSYTNKLLQNNKNYQQQIFQLKQQTSKIRSQLEKSIAENIKFRMSAQKKEEEIKEKFTLQIAQLVKELKEILEAKQEMEMQYNKYIQEMVQEHAREMEGREESFSKTQEFFKEKLANLKDHLSLNKEQRQKQYFQASECKLRLMKQIDQLNYSIQKQRNEKREFQKSNQEMIKIIKNLEKQLKEVKEHLEKQQLEVFKIEKEKNEIIIDLKNQNKSLCEGVKDLELKIGQLDRSLSKKETEFGRLENELMSMKKELDQTSKAYLEKNLELESIRNHKRQLDDQNTKLSQNASHQKSSYESFITELQTSIRTLSSELSSTQSALTSAQKQISSLTSQIQSLQKETIKLVSEMGQLEQLNKNYKKDNIQFLQELQFLTLENKSMKEDKLLKENHLKTLEQMCEQLQKSRGKNKDNQVEKIRWLEENQRLQAALLKDKNNEIAQVERLLKKKFELQILDLKEENESLKDEIQQIVKEYEKKLTEKQLKWQQRVENIEKDLEGLINSKQLDKRSVQQDQKSYYDKQIEASNTQQKYTSTKKQTRSPYITKNRPYDDQRDLSQQRKQILSSLTRRDAIKSKYIGQQSPSRGEFLGQNYERRSQRRETLNNEENSFRKRDNRYYEDVEKRLNQFSNSRKLHY